VREGGVEVVVEGHGSSTGPPALVSGRADLAAMTRPMSYAELDAFRRRVGGQPIAFVVAIDALLVFVQADNPIEGLSLGQVDAIFSRTRRCGDRAPITRWSELGLPGEFARHQIVLYGLGPRSGTRDAFRNLALCGDGFRDDIRTMPGRMRTTTAVAESPYAIGYGGLGDRRAGVRAVPLAHDDLAPFVAPDAVGLESGAYPLVRWMYLYARRDGPGLRDPALRAFLAHALSETGQRAVRSVGFLSVPPSRMAAERGKLP
jgi:phosphate transport system substrate-binding protein